MGEGGGSSLKASSDQILLSNVHWDSYKLHLGGMVSTGMLLYYVYGDKYFSLLQLLQFQLSSLNIAIISPLNCLLS